MGTGVCCGSTGPGEFCGCKQGLWVSVSNSEAQPGGRRRTTESNDRPARFELPAVTDATSAQSDGETEMGVSKKAVARFA